MKNKEVFQNKISRLESINTATKRAISLNDRAQAFELIEKAEEALSDLQTMLNRE